jgi:hypothetical protein
MHADRIMSFHTAAVQGAIKVERAGWVERFRTKLTSAQAKLGYAETPSISTGEHMDRTTKLLLAAIAVGLFANAAASVTRPAVADTSFESHLSNDVQAIASRLSNLAQEISSIAYGTCKNSKLC